MGKRTRNRIMAIMGFAPGRWFQGFELTDAGISPSFLYGELAKLRESGVIEYKVEDTLSKIDGKPMKRTKYRLALGPKEEARAKGHALFVLGNAVRIAKHSFETDPASGAGNCWCGRDGRASIHQVTTRVPKQPAPKAAKTTKKAAGK